MYRVAEVAKRLGVSPATIYALAASGRLRHVRIGLGRGTLRFTGAHIDEFLAGAEPSPPAAPATPAATPRLKHIRL